MTEPVPAPPCPRCGQSTTAAAGSCSHCGAATRPEPAPPQVPGTAPATGVWAQPLEQSPYRPDPPVYRPAGTARYASKPPSHLGMAIVALLLVWPFGIPAVMHAAQVDSLFLSGDHYGAEVAGRRARMWSLWSIGSFAVLIALYFIFFFAVLLLGFGAAATGPSMSAG